MNENRILQVLHAPHVSEKAAMAAEANQYVFKVSRDATKLEIKKAVESLFNVSVETVRTVNIKGKSKRFGLRSGRRGDVRKAYVRLAAGQEIELATAE